MKTLNEDLKSGQFKQVYLLCGEEGYLKKQYKNRFVKAMLPEGDTMNYSYYEGKNTPVKEAIDLAETLPFFAERRLIVFENTGFFKTAAGADLADYIKDMPETTCFIFVEEEIDKRNKLYKAVKSKGYIAELSTQDAGTLKRWVAGLVRKEQKQISESVIVYFLDKVGTDMENIQGELEKVFCYALERDTITKEDIDAVCVTQITNHIFEMVDAVAAGNQQKALDLYYELLALKEPPMRILFLLVRQYRMLFHVKALANQGYGRKEIASKAGLHPFVAGKNMEQAKRFKMGQLRRVMEEGAQLEQDVKTGLLTDREMQNQVLDNMDLERERGITIKSQAVRIVYHAEDGEEYIFNLIDTPGHVDFNYEVSRSLAACEGAVLVVDAAQGIEAQTLANVYLALDHDLEIMPVINKIDLPSADPDRVVEEIEDVIGIEAQDAPKISAKNGINIEQVLEQIVKKIPAPGGSPENPLQALIFDSVYDSYKGVIIFARIMEGTIKKGTNMLMMATGAKAEVVEVGTFGAGQFFPCDELSAGMVGYITASLKNVKDTRVGDTVTDADNPCAEPLPGYKKVNSMVFCGIYPADGAKYPDLRDALEKLQLNDAALQYEPETSVALGFGFRCGFLGLLHLEIIQERLEREYNLDLVTTAPSVIYKVHQTDGTVFDLTNPTNLPDPSTIEYMEEPIVSAEIMVTKEYVGAIMTLCQERRGTYISMEYMEETRALLKYELPLNEIIYDFFDALKSRSRGYASFDYEMKGYQQSDLVKLDILINRETVDALSFIVHSSTAYERARKICEKLKEEIPRHLFEIPIQAAIGSKIIARETVKAVRKDVLAKCYGGDISRKKKLLEKQKEGKKRMRQVGNVEIPQKAFMSVLKLDED